ncbi:hypothetical protein CPB84DRAFT_1791451 [Gymnopilus junonius]|uniref:Metallothionein n=1 Tax=Gymnopilus junonius TaxID=109634 RepID=A0A9P5NFH1_GYMJU|nr:hypothetical protein CPB84DRAFT_1791451 [Gymnopilus junonius]
MWDIPRQGLPTPPTLPLQNKHYTTQFLSEMAPSDCTCESACTACGPSGTGCACAKGKCDCAECPNKAHTAQCACQQPGHGDSCGCTNSNKPCNCS